MSFKEKKRKGGKRWGSAWMRGLVTVYWAFCLWVSHSNPPWVMNAHQPPATAGPLGPHGPGQQVSPALHVALIHTMVHGWSQETPVETNLAWRGGCVESWDQPGQLLCLRWSGRHIQQLLERTGPPSRPLLLQPLLWAQKCDGITGNKTNKKPHPKQNPYPLFATACSSTVTQALHIRGNHAPSLRDTARDADLEGHLVPQTAIAPASHRPVKLFILSFQKISKSLWPSPLSKRSSLTSQPFQGWLQEKLLATHSH